MERNHIMMMALALVAILSLGCAEDSQETEYDEEDADVNVLVGEMYFNQEDADEENVIDAETGDLVRFYNEGDIPHTATVPEFDFDEFLNPGEEAYLRVDSEVEEVLVDCTLHGNHEAVLTVS